MKNLFKRTLSILLAVMMLSGIGIIAGAEMEESTEIIAEGYTETGLEWTLDSEGNFIIGGEAPMVFERPNLVSWFSYKGQIKTVTIKRGVTSIGNFAFQGCTELHSVKIPKTISSIGKSAFSSCKSLTEIVIPENVYSINSNAFSGCTGLESVEIYKSLTTLDAYAFGGCENVKTIKLPAGITIDPSAFTKCNNISAIYFTGTAEEWESMIPDTVNEINGGFWGAKVICNSPVSLYAESISVSALPQKNVYMEGEEFDLTGLELTVDWSDGTTTTETDISKIEIEEYDGIESLITDFMGYEVLIPISVKSEAELYPSGKCGDNLHWRYGVREKTLTISGTGGMNDYNSYGSNVAPWDIYSYETETLILEEGITHIGNYAFTFSKITDIEFPDSLESIGKYSFDGCENIETLEIPDNVTAIGKGTFARWHKLTSVKLPKNIKTIPEECFYNCGSLKTVCFSSSVTSIRKDAFGDFASIESVYFEGTVEDWSKISIYDYNDSILNADLYFNGELHSHSYSSAVTKEASCTKTGVLTYTCECAKSYTEEIPLVEHKTIVKTVPATCTAEGKEYDYCESCKRRIGEVTAIPVIAHTPGEWVGDGLGKIVKKCTVCGTVTEEAEVIVDKTPQPAESEVNYGDSIVLDSGFAGTLPEGAYIVWTASNENFDMEVSEDGRTCTITSVESGETTFTATVYGEDGNVIEVTEQTVTSDAGIMAKIADIFDKIFGFIKSLFLF